MSIEPFIYLSLFLFIALITYLVRWLRGEVEKIVEPKRESKTPGLLQEGPALFVPRVEGHQPREKKIRKMSVLGSAMLPRKRRKVEIHPGSRYEFRRGIVLMTILGPCRALERPNESTHF